MNSTDTSEQNLSADAEVQSLDQGLPPEFDASMADYYRLQKRLLLLSFMVTGVAFFVTCFAYSLSIALNYLIGASVGIFYLRMLGKDVARMGRGGSRFGGTRLVLVVGLIILASQWNQLQILPIFLGFLTYKAAILIYTVQVLVTPKEA